MQATTKSIALNVRGNLKQLETIKHWMDDSVIDIAYGGSKGCMTFDAKIRTNKGLVNISDVKIGDRVLTINEATKQNEYKLVLDTKQYGTEHYHKLITFVLKNGEQFSLTPNHEIYIHGDWIASGTVIKDLLNGFIYNEEYFDSVPTALWFEKEYHFKHLVDKNKSLCDRMICHSFEGDWLVNNHKIKEIILEVTDKDVYDLCVDSNNNYCVTSENLIVHNSGKSFLGCSLICGDALMYPETHYFIARQSLTDLRKYTIPSIQEVLTLWGITDDYWKYNGQDNYVKFHNGSKIFFLDAKFQPSDPNYMRFGSMQMTRGWIEESGEFDLECKNNLQASIGRWKNKEYNLAPKLLQTCNPSKNYLYKDYYKANQDGTIEPFRRFVQALPSDNKTLPKDYIENLKKTLSYNEVQRLVYGNWEFDDNPLALMDYTDILGMFTNEFVKPTQERYMSCDISYTGSDKFVITVWHGMVVVKIIAIDKIDDTMVSKKINELRIENRVPMKHVIFDADGLQTFTRNSQQTGLLSGAVAFHNNAKPVKVSGKMENFKNLKAQCYWAFSNACKDSNIFIQEAKYRKQVIEELEQINRKPNQDDGKIALESKKDIKDRLGRSPDFADSLAMRMFFELKGKPKLRIVW